MKYCLHLSIMIGLLLAGRDAHSDWPTVRGDSARSGYTAESLPGSLRMTWAYRAPNLPAPAWSGRDTRMDFDMVYTPVAAGNLVFFGSSSDCQVRALDAASGREVWSFHAEGPVRLAPSLHDGRLLVVSDDGFLYCLAAESGRLLWKQRGGPMDSLVLGNGRLISRWPARGGPVVLDGLVYWAAGIWPSEGIYIYATDLLTGAATWCNDSSGEIHMPQPHAGAEARSGLSCQGELVVCGDKLLVPTGRAVPAVLDRRDGRLLYFHLQKNVKWGGADITAVDEWFFNGGYLFEAEGGEAVQRLRLSPRQVAVTPTEVVLLRGRSISGIPRDALLVERATTDRRGNPATTLALGEPRWQLDVPHEGREWIVAGDTAVVLAPGMVSVVGIPEGEVRLQAVVKGRPSQPAVAGGRLYISTDQGLLYCFAAGDAPDAAVPPHPELAAATSSPSRQARAAAEALLAKSGIREGYCLDLACGDGELAHALAAGSTLQIIAVDDDAENVRAARERLDQAGLLGTRVTVLQGPLEDRGLPPYVANLVVSARSTLGGEPVPDRESWFPLLRPSGGTACFGVPSDIQSTVRGALDGAGEWTHQYSDAANTNCSPDQLAKGPLGMLWFADLDFTMPSRHGRGPAPLAREGRMFIQGIDALRCIDAYTGRTMWDFLLPGILQAYDGEHIMGTSGTGSNMCLGEAGLFVRTGGVCLCLDPADGRLRRTLQPPEPGTWGVVASVGDILVGSLANTEHTVGFRYQRGDMSSQFTESRLLFALDAASGRHLWSFSPEHSIRHNSIAVGAGLVLCIDRPQAVGDRLDRFAARERGAPPEHPTGRLVALRLADGTVAWQQDDDIFGTMCAISETHDVLLLSYQASSYRLESEKGNRLAAFRASSGEKLWDVPAVYASRPIINDRTVYIQPGAWDLLTGEKLDFTFSRAYGCGTLSGSRHLLLYRSGTLGYTDLQCDLGTENYGGVRPGCWINTIAADGLVLMPDATDRCTCSYLMKTSMALRPFGIRPPIVSPNGGVFSRPVEVDLTTVDHDVAIHYTTDGLTPTRTSPRYTGPVRLSGTTELRARAFREDAPPSQVSSATFVVDETLIDMNDPGWQAEDAPGSSKESDWQVVNGVAIERSNIYQGDATNGDPAMYRPGTMRVFTPARDARDGELTIDIASTDDDVLGIAFRYQDPDNYYLWAMDAQRGFHTLCCRENGEYRLLAANDNAYERGRWYALRIVLDDTTLSVYVDGEKEFEVQDEAHAEGAFALYAWGCSGASFRRAAWKPRR